MFLLVLACATAPEGLRATPDTSGPLIRVDYDAEPLPDIPYPNDLATRPDPTSPTGLRLNVGTESHTELETETRRKVNQLTGFGVYAPITVGFEGRLDVQNILDRHTLDARYGDVRFDDDAVLVINVDPDSPNYGKPVALDLGEGRFPMDTANPARYFANDTRSEAPSLIFEGVDEDLNGNGVLDWGEDTDNDGVLDSPNTWPLDGDPREDLLTFYELQSDTLILRLVVPLEEESTYAVVLTDRLTGTDGQVVTSPWEWVNHTSQTERLMGLNDALPALGLTVDNVAFAWTFTTGRQTGDLVDIQRGLDGEGPFASLQEDFPTGIEESLVVHEVAGVPDQGVLPVPELMDSLVELGLFDPEEAGPMIDNYTQFASGVVGGSFTVPNFMADEDGDGTSDEYFRVDPMTGEMDVYAERVPFTCVLPEGDAGNADVVIFGHGYGSSRFDFLGFAHAFNRMGFAACAADFPGHGPTIPADELELYLGVLKGRGLEPFMLHLVDSRYRDLNNDGSPDSGGDQWSADAFHTRDMVRQAAVDWMWMARSIHECGESDWTTWDGGTGTTCDWDGDGTADMGGADARIFVVGGSLGGINAAVAAPVIPEVTAWSAIVPGAGLLDTAFRTEIGGAVEAMVGRLLSPLVVGLPQDDGTLVIAQVVNTVTDMDALPIATLDSWPAGGRVLLENLDSHQQVEGYIPDDGSFRVAIAADALTGEEKKVELNIPETGAGAIPISKANNEGLGDRLRITLFDAGGAEVLVIDTFEAAVQHEGVTYEAGSPLVAGNAGFGHIRGTAEARRVAMTFASILEPGDPVAYAPYYLTGHPGLDGEPVNMLIVPTHGDTIVPVATGFALARSAGYIPQTEDARYGMSPDQWLVEVGAIQGLEQYGDWVDDEGNPILFDVDDLDGGLDVWKAPSEAPLRLVVETSSGVSGLRVPYVRPTGTHGFALPDPEAGFDINTFSIFQIASYLDSGGTEISDDPCLEDASCSWIPALETE